MSGSAHWQPGVLFSPKVEQSDPSTSRLGSGTATDPFIVDWDAADPDNPYNWPKGRKWMITMQLALSTFTVSFGSSSYSGGLHFTMKELHISEEVAVLGISLYVLGFALGRLLFAPLGEMFGRRLVFFVTLSIYVPLNLGGALGHSTPILLVCRFLTGVCGSSPLTNAGGTISDIWNPRERGTAAAIYATVPFLGPIVGPIAGGFIAQSKLGWHFNFWVIIILTLKSLMLGYFVTPETYAPVLLRKRALRLTKRSNGKIFSTKHDVGFNKSLAEILRLNLSRPFKFVVTEPIVGLFAIYVAIVYGTLYALFSAFPIVFQVDRSWSAGDGGLAFLGVGFGILLGTSTSSIQNRLYKKSADSSETGIAPPEARLHMAMCGAILVPIGLFWFAWTSDPSVHWIVSIMSGVPFGTGVAQILQCSTAYLMDAYGIYFASAITATVILRSLGGAVFPLISPIMFARLGDHWAMSVFGFLSVVCMPIPLLFWRFGKWIRSRSRFAYKESTVDFSGSLSYD